jgi:hypothetical protein
LHWGKAEFLFPCTCPAAGNLLWCMRPFLGEIGAAIAQVMSASRVGGAHGTSAQKPRRAVDRGGLCRGPRQTREASAKPARPVCCQAPRSLENAVPRSQDSGQKTQEHRALFRTQSGTLEASREGACKRAGPTASPRPRQRGCKRPLQKKSAAHDTARAKRVAAFQPPVPSHTSPVGHVRLLVTRV